VNTEYRGDGGSAVVNAKGKIVGKTWEFPVTSISSIKYEGRTLSKRLQGEGGEIVEKVCKYRIFGGVTKWQEKGLVDESKNKRWNGKF
jgi:hypothetical protein